jgi:flagellar hook assembly protein FlgD
MLVDDKATLAIYNNTGQEITTLTSEPKTAGDHQLIWDGRDRDGGKLPNGVYLLKCTVGDHTETQKLLLIR